MQYFGGKAKIAKPLAAFLNAEMKPGQSFVDLFCGSCNVISKIDSGRERVANDLHYELVSLHKAVQNGTFKPYRISEEEYKVIKGNKSKYEPWLLAFAGFGLSFSGKYFGGYARCSRGDDYYSNCVNSTFKKHASMQDVIFKHGEYTEVILPVASLVYCDIPYKNTTKYSTGSFNHAEFYDWVIKTQASGHSVLVSEYEHNVPDGWKVVWRHESKKDIRNKDAVQIKTVEVLMRPPNL